MSAGFDCKYGHFDVKECFLWFYNDQSNKYLAYNEDIMRTIEKAYLSGMNTVTFLWQDEVATIVFGANRYYPLHYTSSDLANPRKVICAYHPSPPQSFISYCEQLGMSDQPYEMMKHLRERNMLYVGQSFVKQ